MRALQDWNHFKYFSAHSLVDQWGDAMKMNFKLIAELDKFREHLKHPIIVTSGFRPGNPKSMHAVGRAVDIVVPDFRNPLIDLFIEASRFDFTGIGMYADWKYNNRLVGGLHLDNRDGEEARWIGNKDNEGNNRYFPMDSEHLRWFRMV